MVVSRKVKFENLKGRVECKYYKTASIHLGFSGVSIFDYNNERSIWDNEGGKILFEGQATLGQGTRISNHGKIYFGTNFRITANSSIICYEKIHFGKDCLISWNCEIMDTDFHKIKDRENEQTNKNREIYIGNHCWIGSRSLILKGVRIPTGCVIAAGSTVSAYKEGRECCIIGSNGKILREDIYWEP